MRKRRADYLGNPLQGFPRLVSQRAGDVTSPAWLAYSLQMVFFIFVYFFIFFIPELISAATYPIAEIFLPTHVSELRVVNVRLEIRKSYLLISQGAKNRRHALFHVFFTG